MPRVKDEAQLGIDEEVIDDQELEAALEEREKRKASLGAVKKIYDGAHQAVLAALTRRARYKGRGRGPSQAALAREYGVTQATIWAALSGRTWQ